MRASEAALPKPEMSLQAAKLAKKGERFSMDFDFPGFSVGRKVDQRPNQWQTFPKSSSTSPSQRHELL